jgi:hypothetical protein
MDISSASQLSEIWSKEYAFRLEENYECSGSATNVPTFFHIKLGISDCFE